MNSEGHKVYLVLSIFLTLLLLSTFHCKLNQENQQIQNLRAFAKLYGYVRYFHPSDEASQIDWNKFAIFGAEKVRDAANNQELKSAFEELFLPIAPTIQIYSSGEKPERPPQHLSEEAAGLKVVAWQHRGLGSGSANSPYMSIRLNREVILKPVEPGVLVQSIDATDLRGKEIKLLAYAKAQVEGKGNQGQLWLRVDRENRQMGFFDNMNDHPILTDEWTEHEISGKVDDDAVMMVFGCFLNGIGKLWVDDFRLFTLSDSDMWEPVDVKNDGFEDGEVGKVPEHWGARSQGYVYKTQNQDPPVGDKCLLIEDRRQKLSGPLFEKHPEVGEVVNKKLCANLSCWIPLALYADERGTLGKNEKYPFDKLVSDLEIKDFGDLKADNEYVRIADVIIAWNILQHFYPYFDVVDVDWDKELTNALKSALEDESERDFFYTLSRLVAKLQDGHGYVTHQSLMGLAGLPITVDWIENQVVVTASKDSSRFHRGDIVMSIDGTRAERALSDAEEFLSGSPQWKRWRSLSQFGSGEAGTIAKVEIKKDDQILTIEVERNNKRPVKEPSRPNIQVLEYNIYYVNLDKAPWEEIHAKIEDLAKAKGVIFDLRGYPNGNHQVICHLLEEDDTSDAWMQIPLIIYPDQENIVDYQRMGWRLMAKNPHIEGKVVFITDGRAISYAESFMGFIEHYKLGEIVGQPTAGTNGNVNLILLPGGYRISWTGMKVVKHDGSQHHLIGIQPTVPAERTIQGVSEGRDEFLEKALEMIKQ